MPGGKARGAASCAAGAAAARAHTLFTRGSVLNATSRSHPVSRSCCTCSLLSGSMRKEKFGKKVGNLCHDILVGWRAAAGGSSSVVISEWSLFRFLWNLVYLAWFGNRMRPTVPLFRAWCVGPPLGLRQRGIEAPESLLNLYNLVQGTVWLPALYKSLWLHCDLMQSPPMAK